jgi:hypothetical protein
MTLGEEVTHSSEEVSKLDGRQHQSVTLRNEFSGFPRDKFLSRQKWASECRVDTS